jgi:O-antigen/teichoic acid export membrane protein
MSVSDDECVSYKGRNRPKFQDIQSFRYWRRTTNKMFEKKNSIPTEDERNYRLFSFICVWSGILLILILIGFGISAVINYDIQLKCHGKQVGGEWYNSHCLKGDQWHCNECPYDLIRAPLAVDVFKYMSFFSTIFFLFVLFQWSKTQQGNEKMKKCTSNRITQVAIALIVVFMLMTSKLFVSPDYWFTIKL